jgi:hypothetical protein
MAKLFNVLGFIRKDDPSGGKDKMVSSIWRSLGGYDYDARGEKINLMINRMSSVESEQ